MTHQVWISYWDERVATQMDVYMDNAVFPKEDPIIDRYEVG